MAGAATIVVMNIYAVIHIAVVLAVAAAAPSACALHAQSPQMVQPEPIASDDPRARSARAVVEVILRGDRAAVAKLLRSEAAPSFVSGADFEAAIDSQIARLAGKGYGIGQLMTGRGADVLVELESATAEATNIVVRFTTEAPHRVEGFTVAKLVQGLLDAARIVE